LASAATLLIVVCSVLLLVPCGVLFFEVLAAILPSESPHGDSAARPSLAVLIPAHNEASVIAATLRDLVPQLTSGDRIVVVADNCTDDTAAVARTEGAEAYVRNDATHRGKGFALDFGVQQLAESPPEVVIVIDADCHTHAGTLDSLGRVCAGLNRPVQSLYLMTAPIGSSVKLKIAEFAWTMRNKIRPRGLLNLGLPCHLTGSGMAFPWHQLRSVNLATGHITEDLAFGIELARNGAPPIHCSQTLVTSEFPSSMGAAAAQRTRWEHGHLALILSEFPRLLLLAARRWDGGLLALALDLCVPPLALVTLATFALWILALLDAVVLGSRSPWLLMSVAPPCFLLAALVLAWRRFGRNTVSVRELAGFAAYTFGKAPLYAKFIVSRQTSWVRAKRGHEPDDHG
jgi:cellulose synthase/poly-beta-1,6-N-acetylglucosamine synthase-like glycosyltransferase